jgi:predicted amidophosphoribosyltransferase
MNWFKNDKDFMSELVYRLKSDNSKSAWKFYAELFFHIHKNKIKFKNYQAIIPIPGSKKSSVHALIFSQELAKKTGLSIHDVLIKDTGFSEQKTLKAKERQQSGRIVLKAPLNEQFTNCLFIDDILTTGESFLQSKKALNAGSDSLILSLFYRPKAL